jgi:hypothetical protein
LEAVYDALIHYLILSASLFIAGLWLINKTISKEICETFVKSCGEQSHHKIRRTKKFPGAPFSVSFSTAGSTLKFFCPYYFSMALA